MNRCLSNRILPKCFKSKPIVRTRKAENITRAYNFDMLRVATNAAKQRYHALLQSIKSVTADLKRSLNEEHFTEIQKNVELSREKVYRTIKKRLLEKYERLAGQSSHRNLGSKITSSAIASTTVASATISTAENKIVKKAVLNLTNDDLPSSQLELLNLGPKFVPSLKHVPVLDIVTSTEQAALTIERHESANGSCVKAESLRHSVSNILLRSVKKKLPSNLTKSQQLALNTLKDNDDVKVVPFDKGTGFAVLKKSSMYEKIEEH